jgi:hypothetical protein
MLWSALLYNLLYAAVHCVQLYINIYSIDEAPNLTSACPFAYAYSTETMQSTSVNSSKLQNVQRAADRSTQFPFWSCHQQLATVLYSARQQLAASTAASSGFVCRVQG